MSQSATTKRLRPVKAQRYCGLKRFDAAGRPVEPRPPAAPLVPMAEDLVGVMRHPRPVPTVVNERSSGERHLDFLNYARMCRGDIHYAGTIQATKRPR
jgi:hypothetical protein